MSSQAGTKTVDGVPSLAIKDYAPTKGTVIKHPIFTSEHIEETAKQMRGAFAGLATNEQRIIKILTIHNNEQRQDLKKIYAETFEGSTLTEDVQNELAGTFEELCLTLLMASREYDASCLHEALAMKEHTDEWLVQILAPRTRDEIAQIVAEYKKKFDKDFADDIKVETSGMFQRVLLATLREGRDDVIVDQLDTEQVRADVTALQQASDGHASDRDDEVFTEIFAQRGWLHLKAVFADYGVISGRDMATSVADDAFRFGSKDAFATIVKYANDPYGYIADCIHETFHEDYLADVCDNDSDADSVLIRLVVSHSETDLGNIKERYNEQYGELLEAAARRRCAGDYSKLLAKVISPNLP